MSKRSYRQYCGVAKALDAVGQRWTLLIVRNLLLGPLRYTDLLDGLPGITTNLLAKRLKEMEVEGVVARTRTSPPTSVDAYQLTERGLELEPVVHALGHWGWPYMGKPARGDDADISWALVALKRRFRGSDGRTIVSLEAGGQSFTIQIDPNVVTITRGSVGGGDVRLVATATQFRRWFFQGVPAREMARAGQLDIEGGAAAFMSFRRAFELR